jgi:hypothetical protein
MFSFQSDWSQTTCDRTAPRSESSGSNAGMIAGDGRTTEQRIRISRHDGGNARCSGSRVRVRPRSSFHTRRRLQNLQRPEPSHLSSNAPHASSRGDDNLARGRYGGLKMRRRRPLALSAWQRDNADRGDGRRTARESRLGGRNAPISVVFRDPIGSRKRPLEARRSILLAWPEFTLWTIRRSL